MPSVLVYRSAGSVAAIMASHHALGSAARKVENAVKAEAMSSVNTSAYLNSIQVMPGPLVKTRAGSMHDQYVVSTDRAAYNIEFGRLVNHDGIWRREGGHLHFTHAYLRL